MPGKLQKFKEFKEFSNCFSLHYEELNLPFQLKSNWNKDFFKNGNPIVLELGCGRGEYTIGLAERFKNKNFIGVDIKGNRIWTGAKHAIDQSMENVAFLRTRIDFIEYCFGENEISEIWITFPDPQPQQSREKKRLTNMRFLEKYKKILKKDGLIHLKTDNTGFYEYTLEVIKENDFPLFFNTDDLYLNCPAERKELTEIKTYYEKMFTAKGENIKYCCFSLR